MIQLLPSGDLGAYQMQELNGEYCDLLSLETVNEKIGLLGQRFELHLR
jgi:hypothetical protein